VLDANQAGNDQYDPAPQVQATITVHRAATTTTMTLAHDSVVYGQPVTATATVTGTSAGSVQFSLDGVALGAPVALGADGTASSPNLLATGALAPGAHQVGAAFTPSDTGSYAGSSATTVTLTVAQAATAITLAMRPDRLSATVTPVAPGAGVPTGTVTFRVGASRVGQAMLHDGVATLAYRVRAGQASEVAADYGGDVDFTASSTSSAPRDPRITAKVSSAHPKSRYGWYRSAVTVTFTCEAAGAPLTAPCPGPVQLSHDGAGQTLTRTITATDGGTATATVRGIDIDTTPPTVTVTGISDGHTYLGVAPPARCIARDALSGVASCRITRHTGPRRGPWQAATVYYTATATDRAGNQASVSGSYQILGIYLRGAHYHHGAFTVRLGHAYTLVVTTSDRPRYYDPAPYPARPAGKDRKFYPAQHSQWILGIAFTRSMRHHRTWNLGIKTDHTLHVLRVHVR
jgi:hypothetical protein